MVVTLFGSISGLALGMTRGTGAVIMVPLLVYGLRLSVYQAVTLSLLIVGFTASLSLISRWRAVDTNVAFWTVMGGILSAPLGARFGEQLTEGALLLFFSLFVVLITAFKLSKGQALFSDEWQRSNYDKEEIKRQWPMLFFTGVVGGFVSGVLGLGGGVLLVPAFVLLLGMNMTQASATSLLSIIPIAIAAALIHLGEHPLKLSLVIFFLASSILGVWLGARCAKQYASPTLRKLFTAMLLISGIILFAINFLAYYSLG